MLDYKTNYSDKREPVVLSGANDRQLEAFICAKMGHDAMASDWEPGPFGSMIMRVWKNADELDRKMPPFWEVIKTGEN